MKTQITNLINGAKNVIRNMEDQKYATAKPATSHNGYAGTNSNERNEVAMKVYEENQQHLHITAKGIDLTLPISRSTTGKSWSWSCDLTLYSFTRRSEAAQWRSVGPMTYLDESFITIF